jgi:hypothetical protein
MLRSSSTPVLSASPKTIPKSQSSGDLDNMQRTAARPRPHVFTSFDAPSHIVHSPPDDLGDPFNLSNFFSATDKPDGDWTWLKESDSEAQPLSARTTFLSVLDEEANQEDSLQEVSNVLESEDKLGVLSLRKLPISPVHHPSLMMLRHEQHLNQNFRILKPFRCRPITRIPICCRRSSGPRRTSPPLSEEARDGQDPGRLSICGPYVYSIRAGNGWTRLAPCLGAGLVERHRRSSGLGAVGWLSMSMVSCRLFCVLYASCFDWCLQKYYTSVAD